MSRLKGKVAIVTGSSSGVGRAIAMAFANQGTSVVVCADLQPEGLPGVPEEAELPTHEAIESIHGAGSAVFIKTDATISQEVEACVARAARIGGKVDILVNVVGGVGFREKVHQITDKDWDRSIQLNLNTSFWFSRAVLRQFLSQNLSARDRENGKQRGVIINISSVFALVAHSHGAGYNSAKAALVNLTRSIALDYAPDLIRCNCICPAFMRTAQTMEYLDDPTFGEYMRGNIPLWKETGKNDVASTAVFLASENEAGWITGVAMPVDGGFTAK